MIDQIRASKLPSNMMQFAARGALSVPPAENLEILVYLAKYNKVFGDVARMTLAGWDAKASFDAASNPETPVQVLDYLMENLRPQLLPALLENPAVAQETIAKFAISASRESIETMLKSSRVRGSEAILDCLRSNPYLNKGESEEINTLISSVNNKNKDEGGTSIAGVDHPGVGNEVGKENEPVHSAAADDGGGEVPDETVSAYLSEHASEIAAEGEKPFQAIGGVLDLLGKDYFPVSSTSQGSGDTPTPVAGTNDAAAGAVAVPARAAPGKKALPDVAKRDNAVQKINRLDIKGRIQLALKGNKEERSLLIRDGTKVVALAVLEAPKLSDGEVEKFASQKNVLESVLRAIPLKRRFMKNYGVVRNLVGNPRTPLDLGLGLMKHLLTQDLKNLSANKEVSETIRKLAHKMYKQKLESSSKK
jgi:hypothetical protein